MEGTLKRMYDWVGLHGGGVVPLFGVTQWNDEKIERWAGPWP
jgi:hypothetical protein